MGSGKSTVGPILAAKLRWSFVDLDAEIENLYNAPIRAIFETHGEGHFRRLETETIKSLNLRRNCIVALGGGAFIRNENRALIKSMGYSVFLDCPLETLLKRCPTDGTRPLLQSSAKARELYLERLPFYQTSDIRVDVSTLPADRIADLIIQRTRAAQQSPESKMENSGS